MTAVAHRPCLDAILAAAGPVAPDLAALRAHPRQDHTGWDDALRTYLGAVDGGPDAVADALLPAATTLALGLEIAPDARASIRATLAARLAEATQGVPDAPSTADGWLAVFGRRPALAFVIGVVCAQWRDALLEIVTRLADDRETLRRELWDGAEPGPLVGYQGDAGDRHNRGRSVALLHFAAGVSVVYKPKELRHVAAVQELIAFVNANGLERPLAVRGVVLRGDYGWEEFVRARPVGTSEGVSDFYRRLGMHARLMQLLGGRDLWADNLIAAGDQPMFIDLECVMTAPARPTDGTGRPPQAAVELEDTVVPTSLVLQPWTSPQDIPVLDVGCLSRAGDVRGPGGGPLLPLPPYRPFTAGAEGPRPADPWAFGAEVLAGYRDMHAVLAACHDRLLAGPLAGLRGAWVRYIRRNTWDCYKIIRASVTPAATVDGAAREDALAALLRWPLSVDGGTRTDLIGIALAEVDAFRVLDIPIFGSRTDSTSVFAADGTEIPDHFATTSWDLLQARVAELPAFDLERHVAVLASGIDAARDGSAARPVPAGVTGGRPSDDELVAAAAGIARGVLAARRGTGWIGQTWYPATGLRHVELLGPDLAAGTAGFAVLLAELAAHTDDDVFAAAALDVLDDTVKTALAIGSDPGHQRIAGNARVPGGFYGPGAAIHAVARCAERLRAPHLLDRAAELLEAVGPDVHAPVGGARAVGDGLVAGRAGLLLNLLRLRSAALALDVRVPVDELVIALVERLAPRCPADVPAVPRGEVPGGPAGVALALARAGRAVGHLGVTPDVQPPATIEDRTPRADLGTVGLLHRLHPGSLDARDAAGLLLARHRATGRWFPERWCDDRVNLGALDGTTAIALGLLGVADPATRPLATLL